MDEAELWRFSRESLSRAEKLSLVNKLSWIGKATPTERPGCNANLLRCSVPYLCSSSTQWWASLCLAISCFALARAINTAFFATNLGFLL